MGAQEDVCVDISFVNRFAQLADQCVSIDDGHVLYGGEGGDLSVCKYGKDR